MSRSRSSRWGAAAATAAALAAGSAAAAQDNGVRELEGRTKPLHGERRPLPDVTRPTDAEIRALAARRRALTGKVREITASPARLRRDDRELVGRRVPWDDPRSQSWRREHVAQFVFDDDVLRKGEPERLEAFAEETPWRFATSVRADGHTDGFGSDDYNVGLSARRADTICEALAGRIDVRKCHETPHGEADLLVKETGPGNVDNPRARAINRRVKIVVWLRAR